MKYLKWNMENCSKLNYTKKLSRPLVLIIFRKRVFSNKKIIHNKMNLLKKHNIFRIIKDTSGIHFWQVPELEAYYKC